MGRYSLEENWEILKTYFQSDVTIDILRPIFENRIIGRNGDVNWSLRSCDLTPLDYLFGEILKMHGKGQDSSDSRSRRSSATWWRRAAAIQGGTALVLSVNHQSFTPPFEAAVKRQTYEPLFISFQKYYNRIDDRDGGDNHQSVTADKTSVVCEAARDKVGALL
ncbi:hypothetical protein ACJJTC_008214 [Scirpophaga incertulas]